MTTLTKLLPPEAAPAQPILDRAHTLSLTLAERVEWPQEVKVDGDVITFGVTERRVLEVNDVFVDEKGEFWAVRPAVEKVLHVTGDLDLMREAAGGPIKPRRARCRSRRGLCRRCAGKRREDAHDDRS